MVDVEAASGIFNEKLVARLVGPAAVPMQAVFATDCYIETEEVLSGAGYLSRRDGCGG